MENLKVSVITPVYNGAEHISQAIQSVLDQKYKNFELIVINDASPDDSEKIVARFNDPRLRHIVLKENLGAAESRNFAIRESTGDILAFLDQDDLYHPEKLKLHVDLYQRHPEVGATYNPHYDLNYSSTTIRNLSRPPREVGLRDLVLGFPIPPSDLVIKRQWMFKAGLWDPNSVPNGGEYILLGNLALDGCKFASVDRALNYRRHEARRTFNQIELRCRTELYCQDKILSDPRCPEEIRALQTVAHANTYMVWAYYALAQAETGLGQDLLRKAVALKPEVVLGYPCELVTFIVENSIADDFLDHNVLLRQVFDQLPEGLSSIGDQYDWAVQRGYLQKVARAVIWSRIDDAQRHFEQAIRHGARVDESFLRQLTHDLLNFENECGAEALDQGVQRLRPFLERVGTKSDFRWLTGCLTANRALRDFQAGSFSKIPGFVIKSIIFNPSYLANRGLLSIMFRSVVNRQTFQKGK